MEPLVSVIMPNFNSGAYIGETIKSVLNQTYSNFEFIIVDDASTDASREIIGSFDDERIRLIEKTNNEHVCRALNTGIEYVKGSYIARVDSDDRWKPEKLKKQIEFLENNRKYGACFTWVDIIDETGEQKDRNTDVFYSIFAQKNRSREEWIRRLLFEGNCLCHPSSVIRTDLVRAVNGYRDSLLQLQDYDMWLRLLKHSDIYVLEEELTEYRRIEEDNVSISAKSDDNNTRWYNETVYILEDYFDDMEDDLFISCFGKDFVNKSSRSTAELACEKAFLLYQIGATNAGKEAAIRKLESLIDDDNYSSVLRDKFGFNCKDFYKLNKEHYYFDCVIRDNNDKDLMVDAEIYYTTEGNSDFVRVSQRVHIKDGVLRCSFDLPSDVANIRFDPVDNRSCIITEFKAVSGDRELSCMPINGQVIRGVWLFGSKDPQINIAKPEVFDGSLKIEAKIFTTNSCSFSKGIEVCESEFIQYETECASLRKEIARIADLESSVKNYSDMVEAKDNHIFNLENIIAARSAEVDAKEQHIQNLEAKITEYESTISEMENTKVWKLYRKLKKG